MTLQEACAQAFENGRKVGDAEGYARGKAEAFAEAGDLISRKVLLEKQYNASQFKDPSMAEMVIDVRDVEDAPAVAARPVKRGRWVFGTANHREYMKCSECLKSQTPTGVFTHCPNCGARMDGGGHA